MSITSAQILMYKAAVQQDGASNGGTLSSVAVTDAVKNNVWPDVPQSERAAGSTKYRKVFYKIASTEGLAFIDPKVFIETPSPGNDVVSLVAGTQTDVGSNLTGSERNYGAGYLNANASAGATSISVLTEGASFAHFQAGDKIRISNKTSLTDTVNVEEYATIATGGVSYAGAVATLTLTSGLLNTYATPSATKVASCYQPGTIQVATSNLAKVSTNGTYNTVYTPIADNVGGIQQTWTLTFTSATVFTCTGDTVGLLSGSGSTSASYSPTNTTFSRPYFTIPAGFFTGTWATGNTVTFTTSPAAVPLWLRRDVPANCASLAGNKVVIGIDGESA